MNGLHALPASVIEQLLLHLGPQDLVHMESVCRAWRRLPSNAAWWRLCMRELWLVDSRPTQMSKNDRKKRWKLEYSQLPCASKKPVFVSKKVLQGGERREKEEGSSPKKSGGWVELEPPSKEDMRVYYKSIRSKPKRKRDKGASRTHSAFESWADTEECPYC
ncbi:hypothetical protein QOT17_011453 [Balamuthia mandrillaris]